MKRALVVVAAVSAVVLSAPMALAGSDPSPSGPVTSPDASGDSLGPDATSDILSASIETTGTITHSITTSYTAVTTSAYKLVKVKKKVTVKVKGKTKKVTRTVTKKVPYTVTTQVPHSVVSSSYTADTLALSMTLGETPDDALPGQTYTFAIDTPACGTGAQDTEFVTWFGGDATATAEAGNCSGSAGSAADVTVPVKVTGDVLEMDVPLAAVADFGIAPGVTLTNISADTSTTDPLDVSPVSEVDLYDSSDTPFTYTVD